MSRRWCEASPLKLTPPRRVLRRAISGASGATPASSTFSSMAARRHPVGGDNQYRQWWRSSTGAVRYDTAQTMPAQQTYRQIKILRPCSMAIRRLVPRSNASRPAKLSTTTAANQTTTLPAASGFRSVLCVRSSTARHADHCSNRHGQVTRRGRLGHCNVIAQDGRILLSS